MASARTYKMPLGFCAVFTDHGIKLNPAKGNKGATVNRHKPPFYLVVNNAGGKAL